MLNFDLVDTFSYLDHSLGTARISQHQPEKILTYETPALDDIIVQKIAAEFGYHPNYISQIFKESTDKTLRDYLTHYRIRMAKNLLRTTELDVGTIGWKCGFNSVSYFIKVFRQHTGMTPHKFQKSQITQLY